MTASRSRTGTACPSLCFRSSSCPRDPRKPRAGPQPAVCCLAPPKLTLAQLHPPGLTCGNRSARHQRPRPKAAAELPAGHRGCRHSAGAGGGLSRRRRAAQPPGQLAQQLDRLAGALHHPGAADGHPLHQLVDVVVRLQGWGGGGGSPGAAVARTSAGRAGYAKARRRGAGRGGALQVQSPISGGITGEQAGLLKDSALRQPACLAPMSPPARPRSPGLPPSGPSRCWVGAP